MKKASTEANDWLRVEYTRADLGHIVRGKRASRNMGLRAPRKQKLSHPLATWESAMPASVEELATQAIRLSPEDRARLADLLLASLPEEDPEVDAAWDQEIRRRVGAVDSGTARLVSAAEVHAQARKIYQR